MLRKKAFDFEAQKAMHETTIQVADTKNQELRNEMYQLDREINHLQGEFAKLNEESRILETRKVELDEKRKYALEFASNAEKAKELKTMLEEAHYEYEDRNKRFKDLDCLLYTSKGICSLKPICSRKTQLRKRLLKPF